MSFMTCIYPMLIPTLWNQRTSTQMVNINTYIYIHIQYIPLYVWNVKKGTHVFLWNRTSCKRGFCLCQYFLGAHLIRSHVGTTEIKFYFPNNNNSKFCESFTRRVGQDEDRTIVFLFHTAKPNVGPIPWPFNKKTFWHAEYGACAEKSTATMSVKCPIKTDGQTMDWNASETVENVSRLLMKSLASRL